MNRRTELPIEAVREEILSGWRHDRRWVLTAPAGSGKSTRVPVWLAEGIISSDRPIWVVQPRRLAARLLAARVAAERGERPGETVGYQVRWEAAVSRRTRIIYMTDGVAFRRLLQEGGRVAAGALIFDEFHERRLAMDAALALGFRLQKTCRPDLFLGVLSATLEEDRFRRYWPEAPFWRAYGRSWPVEIRFQERSVDFSKTPCWEAAAREVLREWGRGEGGHALIFLPGAAEIGRAVARLVDHPTLQGSAVFPLHGELPSDRQERAVAPSDRRKVIVATNVAETSVTIAGVRLVVDSGLARKSRFDPVRGINVLELEPISRFSAEQRAGRAGRTGPGLCVRLWTAEEHARRLEADVPEIRRLDLSEMTLAFRAADLDPMRDVEWLDPPAESAIERALQLLQDLGALDGGGRLTETGRRMARYPILPRWARLMVEAEKRGCEREAAWAAALAEHPVRTLRAFVGTPALRPKTHFVLAGVESDFPELIRLWREARAVGFDPSRCGRLGINGGAAREAGEAASRYLALAGKPCGRGGTEPPEPPETDSEAMALCLLAAFPDRVARRIRPGLHGFQLANGVSAVLDPGSAARHADWVVAAEVKGGEASGRTEGVRLNLVAAIRPGWLGEVHPGAVAAAERLVWDEAGRRVMREVTRHYRELVLETVRAPAAPSREVSMLLSRELLRKGLVPEEWRQSFKRWWGRIRVVAALCPEEGFERLEEGAWEEGVRRLCEGAVSLQEVREKHARPTWEEGLDGEQRLRLERLVPNRVALATGRMVTVHYPEMGDPYIAARIQDLYGVERPPAIAKGRLWLLVHILAPNQRPVQITRDLAGFWRERYPVVKRELQRRYPRHVWR